MQYFVSIENTSYFYWQIELLIESFKKHKIEDQLVIAIAENSEPVTPEYKINLLEHKNVFTHDNFNPKCLNKIHSLLIAVKNNLITPPFAVIHPDMVLYNPINPDNFKDDIVFSQQPDAETEFYKEPLLPYFSKIKSIFNVKNTTWLPVGDVILINESPIYLFEKLNINLNKLIEKNSLPSNCKVEKAAWILTILEAGYGSLSDKPLSLGGFEFEQTLLHHENYANFIHYRHGIPPEWSKHHFRFEPPINFVANADGPYNSITSMVDKTSATEYVSNLMKDYKSRTKTMGIL